MKFSFGTNGKLRSCANVADPETYKLPDITIRFGFTPFKALIIRSKCSASIIAPGRIPVVGIVPETGVGA